MALESKVIEKVVCMAGPRGAGKSLLLAYLIILDLLADLRTFVNMPVGGKFLIPVTPHIIELPHEDYSVGPPRPVDGQPPEYKAPPGWEVQERYSEELTGLALFNFIDVKLHRASIGIDELQWFGGDARTSMSVKNKLLNTLGLQVRKKQASIYYTVQNFQWVDQRWRFQTDILVMCRDLAFTPWGLEEEVERGVQFSYNFFDLTGMVTGMSAWSTHQPYKSITFYGKPMWAYFKSDEAKDLDEIFSKITIDGEAHKLPRKHEVDSELSLVNEVDTADPAQPLFPTENYVDQVIDEYRSQGREEFTAAEFQTSLQALGQSRLSAQQLDGLLDKRGLGGEYDRAKKETHYYLPNAMIVMPEMGQRVLV
jgi:hypothetical protein